MLYRNSFFLLLGALGVLGGSLLPSASALTIDFEQHSFPTDSDYDNGMTANGEFVIDGASFANHFTDFGNDCCWEGFALSRVVDTTTPGFTNQYASFAGGGADGSAHYAVAFSGIDAGNGDFVSRIELPPGLKPVSLDVTNVTYPALSMQHGDSFAKKFGGTSGNDPDWFRLDIQALNASDDVLAVVPVYLADYRFADSADDYIVNTWQTVDLTNLAQPGVTALALRFASSDSGLFGVNTPVLAAIDNLVLAPTALPGDFNLDGLVDGADYTIWRDTLAAQVAAFTGADADGDGHVTTLDYNIWRTQFGSDSAAAVTPSLVPEPTSYLSTLLCLLVLHRRIRS